MKEPKRKGRKHERERKKVTNKSVTERKNNSLIKKYN